jgi:hypothetical protein
MSLSLDATDRDRRVASQIIYYIRGTRRSRASVLERSVSEEEESMSAVIPLTREKGSRRTIAAGHRRVAAIDIGSNSIRQIVADVSSDGTIQVVDEMKAAPRLAAGLSTTGALSDTSIHLAIEALERMATLARQLGAERIDSVATSAVRDATNASAFLAEIQRRTGLRVRVLDGDEEARLSFRSAVAHFDMGVGRTVVVDIGGGSLEFALSAEGVIERLSSFPFGAIRLTEDYLQSGVPFAAAFATSCHDATGVARSSSGQAERSPTSPASISRAKESSPHSRSTRHTFHAPISSTFSTRSST